MTPEETELARALVALPGWRWAPGMLGTSPGVHRGLRVLEVNDAGNGMQEGGFIPDISDPTGATAGVLLAMLWTADPNAGWHVHGPPGLVCVHRADGSDEHYGEALGVACARALVALGAA